MAPKSAFHIVAILGTGLIGTSIGLALKKSSRKFTIVGWDKKSARARAAYRRGAIDRIAPSLRAAVSVADCIILAAPLEAIVASLPTVLRVARQDSFIMDVSGLKMPVLQAANQELRERPDILFAGGHPLAGSQFEGPAHAHPDLFKGQPFAVCIPRRRRNAGASLRSAKRFVSLLGAITVPIGAAEHDRIVASTSALPQLVADCLALTVKDHAGAATKLVGPGYQSSTRLAASPFAPWKALLRLNARNVRRALAVFEMRVREVQRAIEKGDSGALRRFFKAAAAARRAAPPGRES